ERDHHQHFRVHGYGRARRARRPAGAAPRV
ncbi:MAG: hypothetical protein AVDCRST_MAG48-2781, partial [uncultured Friedmanniella sp.]